MCLEPCCCIVSHAVGHEVGHMAGQEVGHGEVSTLNYQNSSGSMLAPQPLTTTRVKRCQGSSKLGTYILFVHTFKI